MRQEAALRSSVAVFIGVTGQPDNVGDTALRRPLLVALRRHGTLHVWIGAAPESYLSGLGLEDEDVIYRSRRRWRSAALRRATTGRAVLAFHTGEITLSRAVVRSYLLHVPMLLVMRLRGGAAVHTGVGIRAPQPVRAPVLKAVLALCDLVSWRDENSRRWIGVGTVSPDWAFARTSGTTSLGVDGGRTLLAVVFRHDRPAPSPEYAAAVRDLASAHDLEIVAVAQTERDIPRMHEAAALFGARVTDWCGSDLRVAEDALRDVYRRSSIVVGNRLHGLILAAAEGAVPLGLGTSDVEKLERGLASAGLHDVAYHVGDPARARELADGAVVRRAAITAAAEAAAHEVELLAERVGAVISKVGR